MANLLLLTCHRWPNPALLARALAREGFSVGVLGPWPHPARLLKGLSFAASYSHLGKATALRRAVARWQPDLVIPCDDLATAVLHEMYCGNEDPALTALIARSVGGTAHAGEVLHKSRLVAFAAKLGIATPLTFTVTNEAAVAAALPLVGFPCVVKRDGSWGGAGVHQTADAAATLDAFRAFSRPPGWAVSLRNALVQLDPDHLRHRFAFRPPGITVQQMVPGAAVNRAVLCWQGKVLDGLTIESLHSLPDCGPSSVVRRIEHAGIEEACAQLVAALGLSGFVGFDFMLDHAAGQAWLLEMNPRVTPAATLMAGQSGRAAALLRQALAGAPPPVAAPSSAQPELFVLFPQELQRDPDSAWLHRPEHDVPWDEPRLVAFCIVHAGRMARQSVKRRRPIPPSAVTVPAATLGTAARP